MNFQNLCSSFFFGFKPIRPLSNKPLFGLLVILLCYYGCGSARHPRGIDMDLNELKQTFEPHLSSPKREKMASGNLDGKFILEDLTAYQELRSQLVERFGNIPEVHTFVEMRQKLHIGGTLTIDTFAKYIESANHLFPNEGTEQVLESLRRMESDSKVIINRKR